MRPWLPRIAVCLLGWLALSAPACAQPREFAFDDPYFEAVGDSEAIPFGVVTALAQDGRGLLWIGTQAGLVRFDGYRFRRFLPDRDDPNSLAGTFVASLWVSGDGRLWIGTDSDGLSVFDPGTERFKNYRNDPTVSTGISAGSIRALAGDAGGAVWIGTHDQGLDYFNPALGEFVHYRHRTDDATGLSDDRVRSLLIDRAGDLWVGTADGLQRRRAGTQVFERVASDPADPASLARQRVFALFEAADGKLWLGTTDKGAAWIDPVSATLHWLEVDPTRADRLSHVWIRTIVQPRSEEIWLGSPSGGINIVSAEDGRVLRRLRHDPAIPSSLALDNLGSLLVDRSGLLWVGTWGGGLQRHNPSHDAFRSVRHSPSRKEGLSQPDVARILELADGRLLIGTRGNGVDIFDRQQGLVGAFRADRALPGALADGSITALAQTRDGAIWIGTQLGGLHRLDTNASGFRRYTQEHGLPHASIRGLRVGRDGALWVGTAEGLARWLPDQSRFESFSEAEGRPFRAPVGPMAEDAQGRLWLASGIGLWVLERDAKTLQRIHHEAARPSSLVHDQVNGLLVDRSGRLWVDTAQGLDRLLSFDGARAEFDHISTALGRPGLYFGANLLEDAAGRLWTQWFVLDPARMQIQALSRADGLDIGTPWVDSYTATRDGLFLYGGTQGFVIVDPRRFVPWAYQPPVVVSEFKINGEPQPLGALAAASLRPEHRSFSVEFAALDYSAPEKLRYAYRLEGFDASWIETDPDHRVASYSNLWPGDYALRVRGSNRMGEWSTQELHLPFTVLPAFWQTAWFVGLMVLSGAALAYGGYRMRVARIQQGARELQRLVDTRSAELRDSLQREHEHERLLAREKLASATLLTGGLAHEINNPAHLAGLAAQNLREQLHALNTFLRELAGDDADPDVLRAMDQRFVPLDGFIADILDGSRRVSGIVADLRKFSQPDPPEPSLVAPGDLLRATLRLVGAKYKHSVRFECDLAVDPPLPCFPARLNQVFTNLIVNACDAIEVRAQAGEPGYEGVLRVSSRVHDGAIEFCFEDNGCGMDSGVRARIFEPFFTTKPGGQGTGLGLPVSLGIVNEHGGRIDVSSTAGEGSRFVVHLPLRREPGR